MALETRPIESVRTIAAPPTAVYHALTNQAALAQWLCDGADVDPRPRGHLYWWWFDGSSASGSWTELRDDALVSFSSRDHDQAEPHEVRIELEPDGEGTRLTLTARQAGAPLRDSRWDERLENLQSVLERGRDLRVYNRPMMGFLLAGELDAKQAAALGVPVERGIRIVGTVPGMGAERAGFQNNDVLISLGGRPMNTFGELGPALSPHKAGDTVEVEFYRGAERMATALELSRRPEPTLPDSKAALSERLRTVQAELDAELEAIFAATGADEAARPPAPGEWSANQVLAHLIMTERVSQLTIAFQIGGVGLNNFPQNSPAIIGSIIAAYPGKDELIAALKSSEVETAALVAALPDEVVARKATFAAICQNVLDNLPDHTRGHFAQIRAAIAAAQGTARESGAGA